MKYRILACLGCFMILPLVGAQHTAPVHVGGPAFADTLTRTQLSARDSALHALNRLGYGPPPREVDRVAAEGVIHWIDRQLTPRKIDDGALARRERDFRILDYD